MKPLTTFQLLLLLPLILLSGCLDSPVDSSSYSWGLGQAEEQVVVGEFWLYPTQDSQLWATLQGRLESEWPCAQRDWVERLDLARPRDAANMVLDGGCRSDVDAAVDATLAAGEVEVELHRLASRLPVAQGSVLSHLSSQAGAESRAFAEFEGRLAVAVLRVALAETSAAADSYQSYQRDPSPELQRAALQSGYRAEYSLAVAKAIMDELDDLVPRCVWNLDQPRLVLGQRLDELEHAENRFLANRPEPLPPGSTLTNLAKEALDRDIALAWDVLAASVGYRTQIVESYQSPRLPAHGEAIHMVNEVLRQAERPGLGELVDTDLDSLKVPEAWELSPRGGIHTLALYRTDWSAVTGCS